MKKLTLTELEDHQEETLRQFEEMRKPHYEAMLKHQKEIDVINEAQARFMTSILLAQTKWKLDEQN